MTYEYAVEAAGLLKSYGKVEALRGLDLRIPRGSLCGVAGMNGAGKTTALRLLLGMARADGGTARVCGLEIGDERRSVAIRRLAALVPEQKELFPYMNARRRSSSRALLSGVEARPGEALRARI